ncbi:hypothetical protein ICW40_07460 [Actinotalea ferrariae]|uniref:hypothetical protein n=1 Tax=Actinotalea ferrariae TaxID=1386098 RepID=UPI001C8B3890|nr:hypothetical protein [Actinotalea ferrariae]MBX9244646.1 hypothetical protein [Actinotalea ferrariae]
MSGDEETTTDELLRELVWSRAKARRTLRWVRPDMFGAYAAAVAVVDDHDRRHPDAPAEGPRRVLSIAAHAQRLRQDLVDHPERFTAAAGINARASGAPDPQLLALAGQVLGWLPLIVTHDANDQDEHVDVERGPL